jgi:hypothetical protein
MIWHPNRSQQHLKEELLIETSILGNAYLYMEPVSGASVGPNNTLRCIGTTTKGYFELPNSHNNGEPSELLSTWPSAAQMEEFYHDYDDTGELITAE